MLPDDRREPTRDEYGGVWQFYKGSIPGSDFEYSYTLQLPPEIHNYVIDTYVGTPGKGPLPDDFHFTPQMLEDIARKWEAMDGEWPLDRTAFRAAVEETANHRYYRQEEDLPFNELVEQRESVVNERLDLEQPHPSEEPPLPLDSKGKPIDIEQINNAIDQEQLGEVGPEHGNAFIDQDLLEPAPLNFGQSMGNVADYMKEKAEGLRQTINDSSDTFGR